MSGVKIQENMESSKGTKEEEEVEHIKQWGGKVKKVIGSDLWIEHTESSAHCTDKIIHLFIHKDSLIWKHLGYSRT